MQLCPFMVLPWSVFCKRLAVYSNNHYICNRMQHIASYMDE